MAMHDIELGRLAVANNAITPLPHDLTEHFPYELRAVRCDLLERAPEFNREINVKAVKKIVKDYNPALMQPLTVSIRRDGRFYIIDGQHRQRALLEMGYGEDMVPCAVYRGLTAADEAWLFEYMNTQRRELQPGERFKAALFRGDADAHTIQSIVARHGFHLNLVDRHREGGKIGSVGALTKTFFSQNGAGVLDETLGVIAGAWGIEQGPTGSQIEGIAAFIRRYRGLYDQGRLIDRLTGVNPNRLEADGKATSDMLGLTRADGMGRFILGAYNRNLSRKRLPDWDEVKTQRAGKN